MNFKNICGLLVRVIFSIVSGGVFYIGWMVVAIPVLKSGPFFAKAICWILAPVVTSAGFAAGIVIFELLPGTKKSPPRHIILWPLAGCVIGAATVFFFRPMLIVFGMFALGAASILIKEIVSMKKQQNKFS